MSDINAPLTEEEIKEITDVAGGIIKEAETPEGMEMTEWVFSNDKAATQPARQLFHLFYDGVFKNRIGIMHCYNKATGKVDTVLVGIQSNGEEGVATWPLARILTEGEQDNYYAPDGNGGYLGLETVKEKEDESAESDS